MTVAVSSQHLHARSLPYWRAHPIEFIESCLYDPESGRPFRLLAAERAFLEHAFKIGADGRLVYREWLYSCPRKSGKTTFEALIVITMVLLYGGAYPEAICCANDQEQAQSRVFEIIKRILAASPLLRDEAVITQARISFPAFNATITAIASDAGSAAGSNACCAAFDELWAYVSERARRLWDELTPPPTRKIAVRITVTYAGFEGESVLLEELYHRGQQLPLVGDSLHAGDGLIMAWHTKPVAPWQDANWLEDMRRQRASVYQRHVLNQFASSSAQFVDLVQWDRCVDHSLGHLPANPQLAVHVGVDASYKHDSTALVAVTFDASRQQLRLVTHRIYQPTPERTLDFEATVEATLQEFARRWNVKQILYDPWQMQAVAQRLLKSGLPLQEFPQSSPNLTQESQCLFDLIQSQSIVLYPDQQLRLAISRCVAIESPRGWKISKERAAFKIDVIVALAMACHAAVQGQNSSSYTLLPFDPSFQDLDTVATTAAEPTAAQLASERSADYVRHYAQMHGLIV
jgi:hypothetical protein